MGIILDLEANEINMIPHLMMNDVAAKYMNFTKRCYECGCELGYFGAFPKGYHEGWCSLNNVVIKFKTPKI